jgi:phosphate/sulfate permease
VKTSQDISKNISSMITDIPQIIKDAQKIQTTSEQMIKMANQFIIPNMLQSIPISAATALFGSALSATLMHQGTKQRASDTIFKTMVTLLPTITLGMGIGAYRGYKKHEAKEKKDAATTIQKFARSYNAKKEIAQKKDAARIYEADKKTNMATYTNDKYSLMQSLALNA